MFPETRTELKTRRTTCELPISVLCVEKTGEIRRTTIDAVKFEGMVAVIW